MKKQTILALMLAAALVLGLGVAVLADSVTQTITLSAPAEALVVTVPTSLEITFGSEDGLYKGSCEATITNESSLPIKITDVTASGWDFVEGTDKIVNSDDMYLTIDGTAAQSGKAVDVDLTLTAKGSENDSGSIAYEAWCQPQYVGSKTISVTYTVEWANANN